MNARNILFETNRFNLSKVGEHFINPCCFGEDAAAWLRGRLAERGIESASPGQEDWGWYLQAKHSGESYILGINGNTSENVAEENEGKWRIIVKRDRSIWGRITGKGRIALDDAMVLLIERILRAEPDFRNIHRDPDS